MATPLKHREFLMLLALTQQQAHGYALKQEVLDRSGGSIDMGPGTLYRTIRNLEDAGLIAESSARPEDDDPRRRYYAITDAGKAVAAAEARRLDAVLSEARAGKLL